MKKKWLLLIVSLLIFGLSYGQEDEDIDALRPPKLLGRKAPEYTVETWINPLTERGDKKLVLLYFWSPSNPMPVYVSVPRFNLFASKFAENLSIIGLSPAEPEYISDIVPELKFPYGYAPQAGEVFGIKIFDYCYILDPQGVVVHEGFPLLGKEVITEKLLKKLIRKYCK